MSTPPGSYDNLDALSAASGPAAPAPTSAPYDNLPTAPLDNAPAASDAASAPAPYNSQGTPQVITFTPTGGPSIACPGVYITLDDNLVISAWNSVAGTNSVTVQVRVLKPDGQLVLQSFVLSNMDSARGLNTVSYQQLEGFIVGVTVRQPAVGTKRGQTYVTVEIQRGVPTNPLANFTLLADYLTTAFQPSWPYGALRPALEGPGYDYAISAPGGGVNTQITYTQPIRAQWKVKNIISVLSTGATAGNRNLQLLIQEPAGNVYQVNSLAVQPASTVYTYHFFPGANWQSGDAMHQVIALPNDFTLNSQSTVIATTIGSQPGDLVMSLILQVEEWIDV